MVYGYARVSTTGQQRDGNSLESQTEILKQKGCDEIVCETYTGKTTDRPKFNDLIAKLRSGDTLVVCKLDRFARSISEGLETIQFLYKSGITVDIANMGIIQDTPTGNLLVNMMLCFAQFERDMILERTLAGKEIARKREDFHEGHPFVYGKSQRLHAMDLLSQGHSYSEVSKMTGMSKSTLIRERKRQANQESHTDEGGQ